MLQKIFWFLLFALLIYFAYVLGGLAFESVSSLFVRASPMDTKHIAVDELVQGGRESKPILRKKDLTRFPRSRSEAACIKILEEITGKKFPTINPSWLVWKGKTLELDGYCDELKLALEFSGPLHRKWNPRFEPYEQYYDRITKDVVKVQICKQNKVDLIVVDTSLPRVHWRNYILSRLYDFGRGDMPVVYIEKQVVIPDRNIQIEKELGLLDYVIASKL